jgi:hypothetical protein
LTEHDLNSTRLDVHGPRSHDRREARGAGAHGRLTVETLDGSIAGQNRLGAWGRLVAPEAIGNRIGLSFERIAGLADTAVVAGAALPRLDNMGGSWASRRRPSCDSGA